MDGAMDRALTKDRAMDRALMMDLAYGQGADDGRAMDRV